MVRSGQDFQCRICHTKMPPLCGIFKRLLLAGELLVQWDQRGWVPDTTLQHAPWRSLAGIILLHSWGSVCIVSHGELVQLVTRKAGLLLGEEGLL